MEEAERNREILSGKGFYTLEVAIFVDRKRVIRKHFSDFGYDQMEEIIRTLALIDGYRENYFETWL